MGVESQAILERWVAEPESRPFVTWDQLIVITAQVGEEHKKDTVRDCEARMLPLLRQHGVRFVEVARRGFHEEDGIVVLQDTREPFTLNPDGCFSLSSYLMRSGTVPQFGGIHKCAMKFKAFVIETWLALEFQHLELTKPVYHVFGYNSEETTRTDKSEYHINRHNADKLIPAPKPPLMVFGFNSEEGSRVERSMLYDGPSRVGHYPLDEWGWDRAKCIGYILKQAGIIWRKSACSFCLEGDTMVVTDEGCRSLLSLSVQYAQDPLLTPRLLVPTFKQGRRDLFTVRGEWRRCPVRPFGRQRVFTVTLTREGNFAEVKATGDHRWFVYAATPPYYHHKEKTTLGLVAGDRIPNCQVPDTINLHESRHLWEVVTVEEAGEQDVYCATVADVGAFVIRAGNGNIVTGNCPFCAEATKGEPDAVRRWEESPEDTAKGMLVEYNSLCFNPRGHLYRDRALQDVVNRVGVTAAQEAFKRLLDEAPWALYRVRRIYTKKGKAMRYVEKKKEGSRSLMTDMLSEVAKLEKIVAVVTQRNIRYAYFAEREEDVYPTREGYYVVAPAFMEDKLRGDPAKFEERWERVGKGLPMNPSPAGDV